MSQKLGRCSPALFSQALQVIWMLGSQIGQPLAQDLRAIIVITIQLRKVGSQKDGDKNGREAG